MIQLLLQLVNALKTLLDMSITFKSYEKFSCKRYAENEKNCESSKSFQFTINEDEILNIKIKVEKIFDILIYSLKYGGKITFIMYIMNMHKMLKPYGGRYTYTMRKYVFTAKKKLLKF